MVWDFIDVYLKNSILAIPVRLIFSGWREGGKIEKRVFTINWREIVKTWVEDKSRVTCTYLQEIWDREIGSKVEPTGVMIIPAYSNIIAFDFDGLRDREYVLKIYQNISEVKKRYYVEQTPSKMSLHVALRCNFTFKFNDVKVPFEVKAPGFSTQGYFIYPSKIINPKTGRVVGEYRKLSNKAIYEVWNSEDDLLNLMKILGISIEKIEIVHDIQQLSKIEKINVNDIHIEKSYFTKVIEKFEIKYDKFNTSHILSILEFIANECNCVGLKLFVDMVRLGRWDIPYEIYANLIPSNAQVKSNHCRSTWTIIEYDIARILYDLAIPIEKAIELAKEIEKVQGEDPAQTSPVRTFVDAYKYRYNGLDRVGLCVFKVLKICNNKLCNETIYTLFVKFMNTHFVKLLKFLLELNKKV